MNLKKIYVSLYKYLIILYCNGHIKFYKFFLIWLIKWKTNFSQNNLTPSIIIPIIGAL